MNKVIFTRLGGKYSLFIIMGWTVCMCMKNSDQFLRKTAEWLVTRFKSYLINWQLFWHNIVYAHNKTILGLFSHLGKDSAYF